MGAIRVKIKIAYLPEESEEVEEILNTLTQKRPDVKINEKDLHPPFRHIYLTTKNAQKPHN